MRALFGVPFQPSEFLVIPDPEGRTETAGYADWRERLSRWLAPTAKVPRREPLTFERQRMIPDPTIYQIAGGMFRQETFIAHPKTIAAFIKRSGG